MTDQNTQQQNNGEQKRDAYSLEGRMGSIKSGQTSEGKTWATFKLNRTNGKKAVSCKVFEDLADQLIAKGDGAAVRLFGKFRTESLTAEDGSTKRFQSFKVLRSYDPKYVGTELEGQPNEAENKEPAAA